MKNNKILYIILGAILFVLVGTSVYVNFMVKSSEVVSYILLAQIMIGIASSVVTLFMCEHKKNHIVFTISFLQILFSIVIVILNTVYGYKELLDLNNYNEYMEYVSMNMNVYLFIMFGAFMGLFSLDQYVKYLKK